MRRRTKGYIGFSALGLTALCAWQVHAWASDVSGFPDGYDAVQAAPDSHKVIFENALVRVLEVTVPPNGQTEPMHHHRWPSFFLRLGYWRQVAAHSLSPARRHCQRFTRRRGADSRWTLVRSVDEAGTHARHRVVENNRRPGEPPLLRVEIKVGK